MKTTKIFISIFILVIVLFSSCQKFETVPETDEVEVSFSMEIFSGNIPTRSFENEVLESVDLFAYPTVIELQSSSRTYSFDLTSGSTFSIQKDTYSVRAFAGDETCFGSRQKMPLATYGYNIEITDEKNYVIELVMTGFILACEKEKASSFKYSLGGEKNYIAKNLQETENYYYYIMAFGTSDFYTNSSIHIDLEIGETENTEQCYKSARYYRSKDTGKYFIFYSPEKDMNSFDLTVSQTWTLGEYN